MAVFTNQAILSYRNGTVVSNVVTGELVEVLSATKNALTDTYFTDDTLTYVVSVSNSGATAQTGISITDNLGAYTSGTNTLIPLTYVDGSVAYYVEGELQATPAVTNTGTTLTISGLTVPANGNALVIYQARANSFAPLGDGGVITNTATVVSGNESVTASETVSAVADALLTITKGISPLTVTENGTLTYTFTIRNFGSVESVATDNIVVTDTFNPALEGITVTYNGTVWTEGTDYTYDEATGVFATIAGNITVPAATYSQDAVTGEWNVTPGVSVITVTGTV